jgi:hypothetical protein
MVTSILGRGFRTVNEFHGHMSEDIVIFNRKGNGNVWSFDRKGVKSNVIFHRIDFQLSRQFKL